MTSPREALADELEACLACPFLDGKPNPTKFIANFAMTEAKRDLIVASLRQPAAPGGEPVAWREGSELPPVKKGSEREYIIAVYRAQQEKIYSFAATYLNAVPLDCDECPRGHVAFGCKDCTDDGCPFTGWHILTGEDGESSHYVPLELHGNDKIMGWREVPRWEDRALYTSPPTSDDRAKVVEALEEFHRETKPFGYVSDNDAIERFIKAFKAALSPSTESELRQARENLLGSEGLSLSSDAPAPAGQEE